MASLTQPKFNVHLLLHHHTCFIFFVIGPIDGVKWDNIVIEVPNTLIKVGYEEQAQINANTITK